MDGFVLLGLVLSYMTQALAAQMELLPETLTVVRGEEARFTCSTSHPRWTVMVWLLNGSSVLTISREHGMLPSINPNVTAEDHSTPQTTRWVLVLRRTERHQQGPVTCDLQNIQRKTASLFMQEKGSVKVFGGDRVALKGQRVLFECQAAGWHPQPSMGWLVNGKEVGEGEYNVSIEVSGENLFTVTSNLSIQAAVSSLVDCQASVSALPKPLMSRIHLTVVSEVVQQGDDYSILLAVTATLSTLFLLLLISIFLVLCYRGRMQASTSQRDAIRFDQSVSGRSSVAEATGGRINLGYSAEGLTDVGHNDLIKETHRQMDSVSIHKVPDVVSSSNPSLHSPAQMELGEESSKTFRRVTTV
ncbi:immunoglobulin superfamily member 5 [Myripristis murdjan]|uniref:immunoglobulin superfamily member 5 n=1 Tax=Myripristis murdjan TaxID=586833 RepID=UPI001175F633|nr:immunoglobulin superfamily member 5-like [Myripristis murdjan]